MFEVKFSTENAAFGEDRAEEICRILKEVEAKVKAGYEDGSIRDINGNRIGQWEIT
jgi:hypothetical protein